MLRNLLLKIIFVVAITTGMVFPSSIFSYAQGAARLENVSLQKIEKSFQIVLEHSKSPSDFYPEQIDKPPQLNIYIYDAKITFMPYDNIPIEIPVNECGIKDIIVEECIDYQQNSRQMIKFSIKMTQPFDYEIDSQWKGKFLTINITPKAQVNASEINLGRKDFTEIATSKELKLLKEIKEREAKKSADRLHALMNKERIELVKQKSDEKLLKMKQQAEERMKSGKNIEQAYSKLKAESEISKISSMGDQIFKKDSLESITFPSAGGRSIIQRVTPSTDVTGLESCLEIAMGNYLPVQIAKEQQELAKLRLKEARRAFYPAFLGELNERDGQTITEPFRGRSYGMQAEQAIFSGGKLTATLRKEQLGVLIAKGNLETIKHDFIFKISKAYYELMLAKKILDYMLVLKDEEKELLNNIEKEFKLGSATPAELLTAESVYNQVCYQVASAERDFYMARLTLEKEMFTENINIENINCEIPNKKINANLNECLSLGFLNRPELKVLEQTIKSAKYGEDIIRSEELPNVSLVGSYGRSGEAFSQSDLRLARQWSIMGKVKWFLGGNTMETSYNKDKVSPYQVTKTDTSLTSQTFNTKFSFWDNLAHFTKLKEAQITRKQAEKDLAEMRNKISQEVEDGYYSYLKYSSQLALSVNEIGYRRKQLEILETKKKMNEATIPEIMEAKLQLIQANTNFQQALAGINISIVSLNKAVGSIDYFNN